MLQVHIKKLVDETQALIQTQYGMSIEEIIEKDETQFAEIQIARMQKTEILAQLSASRKQIRCQISSMEADIIALETQHLKYEEQLLQLKFRRLPFLEFTVKQKMNMFTDAAHYFEFKSDLALSLNDARDAYFAAKDVYLSSMRDGDRDRDQVAEKRRRFEKTQRNAMKYLAIFILSGVDVEDLPRFARKEVHFDFAQQMVTIVGQDLFEHRPKSVSRRNITLDGLLDDYIERLAESRKMPTSMSMYDEAGITAIEGNWNNWQYATFYSSFIKLYDVLNRNCMNPKMYQLMGKLDENMGKLLLHLTTEKLKEKERQTHIWTALHLSAMPVHELFAIMKAFAIELNWNNIKLIVSQSVAAVDCHGTIAVDHILSLGLFTKDISINIGTGAGAGAVSIDEIDAIKKEFELVRDEKYDGYSGKVVELLKEVANIYIVHLQIHIDPTFEKHLLI
jgi:hypothetical protein